MKKTTSNLILERRGQLQDLDWRFDISYWQRQGSDAIFEAAWQMVFDSLQLKGKCVSELRLQRSVEKFGRFPS